MSEGRLLTAYILRELLKQDSLPDNLLKRRSLARNFPGIPGIENFERFTEEAAEILGCLIPPPDYWIYDFPNLKELPLRVASRLRFVNAMGIELNGLESVSTELMRFLAGRSEFLELNGLKSLTLDHAKCIKDCGILKLRLNGLRELPGPVARILSQNRFEFPLQLGGIVRLSDEACHYLGRIQGSLEIPAVTELSDAAIRSLCKKKNGMLDLSGLQELSYVGAETLAEYRSEIILDGLEELPESIAALFGNRTGPLRLKGLKTISPESAEALAGHVDILKLDGIETLSPEAARALRRHHGWISFDGLKSIPDDTAIELAKYDERILNLRGLTRIPKPFLECPASWLRSVVRINKLQEIDEQNARKLIETSSYSMTFESLKSISVPVARIIAKSPIIVSFRNLETLSLEVAEILSDSVSSLSLGGLESLTDEVENALIRHRARIVMPDLKELSPRIAAAMAELNDELHFSGLESLPEQAAVELSSHPVVLKFFRPISLSDKAASALSRHRGDSIWFFERLRISDQGMESLSKYRGTLYFHDLDSFSEAAQDSMAKFGGTLEHIPYPDRLTSVPFVDRCLRDRWMFWISSADHDVKDHVDIQSEMISDEVVKMIVDRLPPQGYRVLHLEVTELSHKAAILWSSFPTQFLQFARLESLPPESAGSLAKFAGDRLIFDVLDVASPDVLKSLMTYRGSLELNRFFELDAERAEILSTFEGTHLELFNLWTISDKAAETLSKSRIRSLSTPSLVELSTTAVRSLARFEGQLKVPARIKSRIEKYR